MELDIIDSSIKQFHALYKNVDRIDIGNTILYTNHLFRQWYHSGK